MKKEEKISLFYQNRSKKHWNKHGAMFFYFFIVLAMRRFFSVRIAGTKKYANDALFRLWRKKKLTLCIAFIAAPKNPSHPPANNADLHAFFPKDTAPRRWKRPSPAFLPTHQILILSALTAKPMPSLVLPKNRGLLLARIWHSPPWTGKKQKQSFFSILTQSLAFRNISRTNTCGIKYNTFNFINLRKAHFLSKRIIHPTSSFGRSTSRTGSIAPN